MGEIVDTAAHRAEELLVSAPQGAEVGQEAKVPLADERRGIASLAQERWQGRVRWRQAENGIAPMAAGNGLVIAAAQTVLKASGHQREACRRAHRRVGVAVGEAQPVGGQAVERGRARRTPAIAAQVRVTEIISKNEDDVGGSGH